ncbi:unnamed protein product [Ixodes pacificus]
MHSAAKVLAILFVVAIVVTNVAGEAVPAGITIRRAAATSSPKTLAHQKKGKPIQFPDQLNAQAQYNVQAQAQYLGKPLIMPQFKEGRSVHRSRFPVYNS